MTRQRNSLNKSILQLFRPANLIMVAIILVLLRMKHEEFSIVGMGYGDFSIFVLGMMALVSATYILNDLFDIEIDFANKPIYPKPTPVSLAKILLAITFSTAALSAFYLSFKHGQLSNLPLFAFLVSVLFLYSYKLKCTPIVGNVVVSLFVASLPFAYLLVEPLANRTINRLSFQLAIFAFGVNLARELVKDIEDEKGDMVYGCKSTSVVLGEKTTNRLAFATLVLSLGYFIYTGANFKGDNLSSLATNLAFIVALAALALNLKNKRYSQTSLVLKLLMLVGMFHFLW